MERIYLKEYKLPYPSNKDGSYNKGKASFLSRIVRKYKFFEQLYFLSGNIKVLFSSSRRKLINYYDLHIQKSKIVIIVGAGTLKYDIRLNFAPYYDCLSCFLTRKQIPCFISGIGVESQYNKSDVRCLIFRHALNRKYISSVFTRDNFDELKKYMYKNDILVGKAADLGVYAAEVYNVIANEESKTIGIGIITYERFKEFNRKISEDGYKKLIIELIRTFEKNGIKYKIFTNGALADYKYAQLICSEARVEDKLIDKPNSPIELVSTISEFKAIISSRLHSLILAYSLNIPFIGISWNNKLELWGKTLHLEHRIVDPSDETNASQLFYLLNYAISSGYDQEFRNKFMRSAIDGLKQQIEYTKEKYGISINNENDFVLCGLYKDKNLGDQLLFDCTEWAIQHIINRR